MVFWFLNMDITEDSNYFGNKQILKIGLNIVLPGFISREDMVQSQTCL